MKFYVGIIHVQIPIPYALQEKLVQIVKFYAQMELVKFLAIALNLFLENVKMKNPINALILLVLKIKMIAIKIKYVL